MDPRRVHRYALSAMVGFAAAAAFLTIGARFIGAATVLWSGAVASWALGTWAADRTNRHAVLVRTIKTRGVARVVKELGPRGKVEIAGELWNARTPDGTRVGVGDEVEILSRQGLELRVRSRPTSPHPRHIPVID